MKAHKIRIIISVIIIAVATLFVANNQLSENNSIVHKSRKLSFLKVKNTNGKAIVSENKSQKKRRVKGTSKSDSPEKFTEILTRLRTAPGKKAPDYERNYRFIELKKAKAQLKLNKNNGNQIMETLNWVERGPSNVGGRTRALVVDPSDATYKTWFAGAVGGGVWKTTDAGSSWVPLTDDLPNLAVTCLEIAKSNINILYAGTGEGFGNADAIQGDGIFKSIDNGATWNQLAITATNPDYAYVNRLAIDPSNENIVIAATNNGIFKTIDGGLTWSKVYNGEVQDLRANPENFNTLFAPISQGVMRSHNAGNSWNLPEKAKFGGGRIEIAAALSDTNRLYASVDSSPNKMFSTFDGGTTWGEVKEKDGSNKTWIGPQGWYNNTIGVNPFDENIVYMGGTDLWQADISTASIIGISNITDNNLDTIFSYTPSALPERNGGLGTGKDFWGEEVLVNTQLANIEIRFGSSKTQKAHLFSNSTYLYKNYVDVPFEVWDTKNNKQLMCSFTDVYANSVFNLGASRGDVIFVNNIEYNASNPSSDIAKSNGLKFENSFVIAFKMAVGKSWNANNLPDVQLSIEVDEFPSLNRSSVAITDGYGRYPTNTYTHVDHHNITMFPTNKAAKEFIFLNGNDGGVAVSYDAGASFTEVGNNGYNTSQFYGVDKKPGGSQYFGGMQDNGTWESEKNVDADKTTNYDFRIDGDGYEVSWHYGDAQKMIGGSQHNEFYKTEDGWQTYSASNVGFNGWGNSAVSPFVSKIAKSYSDPDLLYTITTEGVYKSENFGDSWSLIPISGFGDGRYFSFAQVTISIAEPQVVWAGAYSDELYVSKDGGLSFTKAEDNGLINSGLFSGLDTHPTNEATAYATFSSSGLPKVLRTTNYGQTWTDLSGYATSSTSTNGFPNVAAFCVSVMPYNTDIIWVGTDIGIVESTDGGVSWHLAKNGLPQVSIWEMRVVDDEVVVATHGRGIWSVKLPELANHKPPVATLAPVLNSAKVGASGLIINASLRSVYDYTNVVINGVNVMTINANSAVDTTFIVHVSSSGSADIYLSSMIGSRAYKSSTTNIDVYELLASEKGYMNNFTSDKGDVILNGLSINTAVGFSDGSLNSPHPYENKTNYSAVLRVPIIVDGNDGSFSYDDIAIVEPGDAGTVFGDAKFWDYVIVEATNGGDWIALEDGYDSRLYSEWNTAYAGNQNGTPAMYKTHNINLLDKFSDGDVLVIRFRFLADDFTTSWGWSIDNIKIQEQFVGVKDEIVIPSNFDLSQNYPNPFNPSTKISFSLPSASKVKLQVFNTLGEVISTLVNETRNAGIHTVDWNASNLASGVYLYRIQAESVSDSKKFNVVKKMILMK
ncbi:MAG: T9SS type A sorting domain-containing protein [Bacteroidetes bacterium]|nr:T9SS type A sorting domain-containing protein [Bacteroidota bacterium]MBU1114600.1 T9SS type A sorting domain-containing protein [Bacteroidota bacterium]MBU1799638.1 T9SS type A sorting domain-containing protein [Bacteroidota bacterium]